MQNKRIYKKNVSGIRFFPLNKGQPWDRNNFGNIFTGQHRTELKFSSFLHGIRMGWNCLPISAWDTDGMWWDKSSHAQSPGWYYPPMFK